MLNRQNFLFQHEAEKIGTKLIQRKYATRIGVERDLDGYWLNVWWRCGIIAPLTLQETDQLLGEQKC